MYNVTRDIVVLPEVVTSSKLVGEHPGAIEQIAHPGPGLEGVRKANRLDGTTLRTLQSSMAMESYVECSPRPELAGVVRAVWIQRTGTAPYVQRHLPTGGVELHFPIGGPAQLIGPLTRAEVEVIPPYTTIVGVRFHPGTAPPLPIVLDDLVDQRVGLTDLWRGSADRLVEAMALAGTPERALTYLQARLVREFRTSGQTDPLMAEAVRALMPWRPVNIDIVAAHLSLSASQLRRRSLQAVGLSPKALQRTLRFQGFLALAQADANAAGPGGPAGLAQLAMDAGYADQAHLNRECLRLTGLTPRQLIGRCTCGHDHSSSFRPFLAGRTRLLPPV
ncbi:DUF6597 domain-containing transcriptional factor [Kribbella deserti]|uniref:DUF6597 domain-containing transcriptional factor n=1 Tax=Kribbella deserti TaxID=1926257 RepID=A0ABV6QFA0_9ACTN